MRKWLYLMLAMAILYALSFLNNKKSRERSPLLRRVDKFVTVLAWALLVAYGAAFLYWLYAQFIR